MKSSEMSKNIGDGEKKEKKEETQKPLFRPAKDDTKPLLQDPILRSDPIETEEAVLRLPPLPDCIKSKFRGYHPYIDFIFDEDNLTEAPERTPTADQGSERSIGTKKAKKTRGKRKTSSISCMERERAEETIKSAERTYLWMEEGRMRRHAETMAARKAEHDMRIFSMNTSQMTPQSKEFWQGKKVEILGRQRRKRLLFGDPSGGSFNPGEDDVSPGY